MALILEEKWSILGKNGAWRRWLVGRSLNLSGGVDGFKVSRNCARSTDKRETRPLGQRQMQLVHSHGDTPPPPRPGRPFFYVFPAFLSTSLSFFLSIAPLSSASFPPLLSTVSFSPTPSLRSSPLLSVPLHRISRLVLDESVSRSVNEHPLEDPASLVD